MGNVNVMAADSFVVFLDEMERRGTRVEPTNVRGQVADVEPPKAEQAIVDALRRANRPLSLDQAREDSRLDVSAFTAALQRLLSSARVVTDTHGRLQLDTTRRSTRRGARRRAE